MSRKPMRFITFLIAAVAGQICYFPDRVEFLGLRACPTPAGKTAAGCCFDNDYCLTNGLCWASSDSTVYRGGCTDPEHNGIWACGNGLYACGSVENCRKSGIFGVTHPARIMMNTAVQADLTLGPSVTSAASASASTSTWSVDTQGSVTVTRTITSAPTCALTETGEKGPTGAAVPVGVGVGVGVPLLLAIGVLGFLLWRERRRNQTQATLSQPAAGGDAKSSAWNRNPAHLSELQ
ncbi:hypothetical protein C8035_v008485 [Colletotrichum spinosum]|uniref:Uncharacterized protein n=1 Tax=Colletotrichum spinosum TaxID=1347390 RepID=A0A4R8QAR5_9PEZI|nr:hypothetical protein C8035_v008485 [Colletotrichum spinosum]